MLSRVLDRMAGVRWVFLPLGMCALVAVGAHAAADVVGGQVLWCVDRVDALFDALFSKWSVTAPLVDLVGLGGRTFFARAVALVWELAADALVAIPLLGYEERGAQQEIALARIMLRRKLPPLRFVRPIATALVGIAGACSVARMAQGSVRLTTHSPVLSHLAAASALLLLIALFVPRASFRAMENADARAKPLPAGVLGAAVLAPLMVAALLASPILSFFR